MVVFDQFRARRKPNQYDSGVGSFIRCVRRMTTNGT